ncbi:MAG: hypothetical protein JSU85_02320 [Candidatus Zixiibacteriota bacterium]|nr:MAG: hypothetical protein JSU85_02320 [candidate division Zixibacteria bacterium]
MSRSYLFQSVAFFILIILLSGGAMAADPEDLERSGIDPQDVREQNDGKISGQAPFITSIPQDSVLLIPESNNDVVGMYDPYDGTYLGDLINGAGIFFTPFNAIKGPDGNIYVSDQVEDAVFVFDTSGAYLYTYCDDTDNLDNVRGIDFRNDTLFVTTGGIYDLVARFDGPHSRLSDFINVGIDPWDIMFLDDGRALVSDYLDDYVSLYNADGTLAADITSANFPEQIQFDDLAPGAFLNAAWSDNRYKDFDLDGTVHQITPWTYPRGVYRLGNGNLLVTSSAGVNEVEPGTGNVIEVENTGQARFIELFVVESGPPPTGRCCYNNYQDCVDTTQAACTGLGGVWNVGLNCTNNPCPAVGRCCYNNNQDCADVIETECTALGGVWDDTLNCIDNPCPTGGCDYVPGDVNGSDSYNGLDITYGVAYFKGGSDPMCPDCPPCNSWNYCGDVNGSCNYNGLDITYGVAYFKGGPDPIYCQDCPPNP